MCLKQLLRFVVIVLCFGDLKCDYNFFVSKQYKEEKYYCVTNTTFALTWVHKDKQETSVSSYIPNIRGNFDCDFKQNEQTDCNRFYTAGTKWKLSNSLDENINEIILDQRWEDLETIQTEFSTGQLKYKPVLTTLKEDFEIPFSILSDRESHIFLCDGAYPPEANCYWFMLQAWKGNATAIRKCTKDFIPKTSTEWPKKPCSTPLIRIPHPSVPFYLSSDYWSHLKIVKKRKNLSLIQVSNEKKILEWTENNTLINVTHMIIHNKIVNAFWKIHKIEFIYTEEILTDVYFGPAIQPVNNSFCISMFLLMCKSCQLKLTLKTYNKDTIIAEQVYNNSHTGWSEIKFVAGPIGQDNYYILVSTIGGNEKKFWAIDKVRQCQHKEFRMISTNTKAACQLMSKNYNAISFDNSNLEIVVNDNCSEDTIGEFCVPCNWIYDKCERISICSKDEETKKQRCYCSAGYQNNVECYYECETGRYGHGCTKYCGNCGTQCNIVDGKCKGSSNGSCPYYYFTGPKCDIVTTAVFAKSPEIREIKYTEVTVQISSFQLQNSTKDEPISYTIQIKPDEENKIWTDVESNIKFKESKPVTITDLKPGATYFVRGIINIKNRNESYNGDQIPIQNFTTKCEEINENNLKIILFNTSVQIITQQDMRYICETIIDFKNQRSYFTNNTVFENLEPFTDYTIGIQTGSRTAKSYSNKISFRTTEGTPTAVQNLRAIRETITSSSITLQWDHPQHVYGYLQNYVIEYKHLNYKSCQKEPSTSSISKRINDTSITVNSLIPYSVYSFKVYATNNKFNGMTDTISVQTQALEYISEEEIPNITIKAGATEAIIKFSESDECKGPLNVICTLTCISEWCQNIAIPSAKLPKDDLALRNLMPFSNYSLTMRFCRKDNLCSNTTRRDQFQTEPSVPNPIKDLLVYSKSGTTISLRWRPPYPPTGHLEDYKIEFCYNKWYIKTYSSETIANKNICKLWPKFHCVKLSNLEENKEYTIKVYAKNKIPNEYGNSTEIAATTKTEKSEAPSNLKFRWTMQNDLEVKWTHPIRSNGVIQYFQIILDNHLPQNKLTKQYHVLEETYQRNYTYTINATDLQPTTKYTVTVTAFNGLLGEDASNVTDESPPDIPSFKGTPQIFSATNTTITVSIKAEKPRDIQKTDYLLFLLISDKDSNLKSYPELKTFILTNMRLVCKMRIENFDQKHSFTIGNQSDVCNGSHNHPLEPQTFYNITIILTNSFLNKARYTVFSNMVNTTGKYVTSETNSSLLALLSLLLIIPIAVFLIVKKDKLIEMKNSLSADNDSTTVILDDKNESQIPLTNIENDPTQKPKKPTKPKTSEKIYSKCIQITDFENYVKECVQNGEFERQHSLFPRGQTKPWTYGIIKENKSKNRYNNLIAYDHSRVVLEKLENDPYSDYINASYIDGHRIPKAYIATQGPKPNTLFDFWRMIWQENVEHIVMLANVFEDGKKKVEKYWPAINETLETGNITIQHVSNTVFADFEHRIFNITRNGETRQVDQLHFLSWPDHGIPLYSQSIVPFLQKMLKFPLSSKSPIVIHCSAGVGRTGTILLCDICLRMAAREGSVDALRKLQKLRDQRANLVDNVEQYKLAHLVIMECLVGMHTTIPCNEISSHVEKLLKNDGITLQMQYLKDTQWQDEAMKTIGIQGKTPIVVQEKNRFPDIIPEIQGRVFICRDPYDDKTSSYINAIKVDGFRSPGRYIVTQQPLPNTIGDFWRLIEENDVSVIISLNEIDPKDETSCNFWPNTKNPQMSPIGSIILKHNKTLNLECYDLITVHLNNSKIVEIYSIKDWPAKKSCPKSREQFLTFWEDSDAASRRSKTVVVTCYDGVKASGLYVAMSFIIEKMKLEHSCDVCQAVRTVRHNRNQFVQDENQFIFLYQAAVDYINGFQSYANFS